MNYKNFYIPENYRCSSCDKIAKLYLKKYEQKLFCSSCATGGFLPCFCCESSTKTNIQAIPIDGFCVSFRRWSEFNTNFDMKSWFFILPE